MSRTSGPASGWRPEIDTSRVERGLVRLALAASAGAALALGVVGLIVREYAFVARAVGPGIVGVAAGLLILAKRERLFILMPIMIGVLAVQLRFFPIPTAEPIAQIALILLGVGGAVLVRRVNPYTVGYIAILFGIEWLWHPGDPGHGALHGIGNALGFVIGTWTVLWLRSAIQAGTARYGSLFGNAPISIWEEDFTEVVAGLDHLRRRGITDLDAYLEEVPGELDRLAMLIRIVRVNEAAARLLEADDPASLAGYLPQSTVSSEAKDSILRQLMAVWHRQDRLLLEFSGRTIRGKPIDVQLHWTVSTIDGKPDYSSVIVSVVDMTKHNEAHRQLQDLLRSKDEFVASVSHEVRTPLTAVVGLAEELHRNRELFTQEEVDEFIDLIAGQAVEVSRIVEDLLVAARVGTDSLTVVVEELDLRAEVAGVVKSLGLDSVVPIEADRSISIALADPSRVRQVIRNLITNAQRYGGPRVRIVIEERGSAVVIRVCDDGDPIPDHQREEIFQPYYRARQTHGITASVGLGLTISRELARLMAGDLRYHHTGDESVFELSLPRAHRPAIGAGERRR